jgi:hypothetical protein
MYRILHTARLLPSSIVVRLSSTNKIPIRNIPNIDDDDDDDDNISKKAMSSKDYILADSKSSRFKEKNKRKQNQWLKELERQQVTPKTPLSSFIKEPKTASEKSTEQKSENKFIR